MLNRSFKLRPEDCYGLDWIVQCFTSLPTQYRLYGRRFLQLKRPNQQYQSTEGESCKGKQPKKQIKHKLHICIHTQKEHTDTAYTNKHNKYASLQLYGGDYGTAPTEGCYGKCKSVTT